MVYTICKTSFAFHEDAFIVITCDNPVLLCVALNAANQWSVFTKCLHIHQTANLCHMQCLCVHVMVAKGSATLIIGKPSRLMFSDCVHSQVKTHLVYLWSLQTLQHSSVGVFVSLITAHAVALHGEKPGSCKVSFFFHLFLCSHTNVVRYSVKPLSEEQKIGSDSNPKDS